MKKEKDFLQNDVYYRLTYILVGSVIYLLIKLLYLIFYVSLFGESLFNFFFFFFPQRGEERCVTMLPAFLGKVDLLYRRCAKYKIQLSIKCYALSVNVKKKKIVKRKK